MFQSSTQRLRAWLQRAGGVLRPDVTDSVMNHLAQPGGEPGVHPHRRPLRRTRMRRHGAVPPRPSHCISPVRAQALSGAGTRATR